MSQADKIIYTSPLTYKKQQSLYPEVEEKMVYAVQACTEKEKEKFQKDKNEDIILGYFGDYKRVSRNIVPLITAVKQQDLCKLIIAGNGDINIKANNIDTYSRLPYAEVEALEQEVDILVGICNTHGTQIPAKFYYMAGTQKPIILIVDGENSQFLREYFEKYQRYIVCENQPDDITKAIDLAVMQIQAGVRYTLPEEFRPINVAKKILEG